MSNRNPLKIDQFFWFVIVVIPYVDWLFKIDNLEINICSHDSLYSFLLAFKDLLGDKRHHVVFWGGKQHTAEWWKMRKAKHVYVGMYLCFVFFWQLKNKFLCWFYEKLKQNNNIMRDLLPKILKLHFAWWTDN